MKASAKKPVRHLQQSAAEYDNGRAGTVPSPTSDLPAAYGPVFAGETFEIISEMRRGTPARTIPAIAARLGVSQEKLFELLRLSKSAVKGRISSGGKLSPTEQDRVYRAEKVLLRAVQILGDEETAKVWLNQRIRSLGDEVPLSLLDTEVGYELVLDTLGRIAYGVVA